MAKRKREWTWRQLAEAGGVHQPANRRRPDYQTNAQGRMVRAHAPHPVTPALDRFMVMTRRVFTGDGYCVVWRGGATFRVDEKTVTTPARFYWETILGETLEDNDVLRRNCKTPRCLSHKVKR